MKYVITGSIGHISKQIAIGLLKVGHEVTIITSNPERVAAIEDLGAKAAFGSVEDVSFLTNTFKGSDAVYTMIPPTWNTSNWKNHIAQIGKNYAAAIKASGVKNVVQLSSIGAHMPEGCGPVSGLFYAEKALTDLDAVHVKILRPGFFMYNLYNNINLIKQMNIMGGNYGEDTIITLTDTDDIAAVAIEELSQIPFAGNSIRYIVSDERSTTEIAVVLGAAIGNPSQPWINFSDEQSLAGMLQAGLSPELANNYVEMGAAMRSGEMTADYFRNKPSTFGKTKLEDFAISFAAAYQA